MTKLVYIDVGTHFGQEFQSMFGSSWYFFWKLVRRIIGFYIIRKGQIVRKRDINASAVVSMSSPAPESNDNGSRTAS